VYSLDDDNKNNIDDMQGVTKFLQQESSNFSTE